MKLPSTATGVPGLLWLRQTANWGALAILWTFVPTVPFVAWLAGNNWIICLISTIIAAVVPTIAVLSDSQSVATRAMIAVGIMTSYDAVIYATSYTNYQLDAHMLYFVFESLLLVYFCWITLFVGCIHTAVQHLTFNLFLPYFVYPDGTNWIRFGYHAAILVLQLSALVFMAVRLHRMFDDNHHAMMESQRNMEAVRQLQAQQETLKLQAEIDRKAAVAHLAGGLNRAVGAVADSVGILAEEMQASAETMTRTAEEATGQTQQASNGVGSAREHVEALALGAEKLFGSIAEISGRMTEASRAANEASEQLQRGTDTVEALSNAVGRIDEIVSLINSIASQTNLLALNATIEAARAGESGKGFAVVASEVKSLASQTGKATDEIAAQVAHVQAAMQQTLDVIGQISATIGLVSGNAISIAQAVEKQNATTKDMAVTMSLALDSTGDTANTINSVSEASRRTVDMAGGVLGKARDLSLQSDTLRRELAQFVSAMQSAA